MKVLSLEDELLKIYSGDAVSEHVSKNLPTSTGEGYAVTPIRLVPDDTSSDDMSALDLVISSTLWLHSRWKRECFLVAARYEYEAYVTTGQDPGSPRFGVDRIELNIVRAADGASFVHGCDNTDYCARTDQVASLSACGQTCLSAKAFFRGTSWSTSQSCG